MPKLQLRGGSEVLGHEGMMTVPRDQMDRAHFREEDEIEIINEPPHAQERYRQSRDDIGEDITRDGGVIKRILKAGTGNKRASQGDMVYIHYRGFVVSDGREFDDSRRTEQRRGRPFGFTLGKGEVREWIDFHCEKYHVLCLMDTYSQAFARYRWYAYVCQHRHVDVLAPLGAGSCCTCTRMLHLQVNKIMCMLVFSKCVRYPDIT